MTTTTIDPPISAPRTFDRTKRGFGIRAAGRSADLFLYDEIGFDPLFNIGISAERFKDELLALGDVHEINLYINSPGGGVFEGWAIVELLNRHPAKINARIDSRAFSMASVIAMTGDTVSMASNAWMMIHWPYDASDGDDDEMMARIAGQIADSYTRRTGLSRRQIEKMMKEETWMDSKDAVRMGFADSIYEPMKVAACACDLSKFKNVPAALLNPPIGRNADICQQIAANKKYLAERRAMRSNRQQSGASKQSSAADGFAVYLSRRIAENHAYSRILSERYPRASVPSAEVMASRRNDPCWAAAIEEAGHAAAVLALNANLVDAIARPNGSGVCTFNVHGVCLSSSQHGMIDAAGSAARFDFGLGDFDMERETRALDCDWHRFQQSMAGAAGGDPCGCYSAQATKCRDDALRLCMLYRTRIAAMANLLYEKRGEYVSGLALHAIFHSLPMVPERV